MERTANPNRINAYYSSSTLRSQSTYYRQSNQVDERCFNRLNQFRRIATRHDKKADNYLAMLTLASIILRL
ncbi:hypothetical protein FD723_05185 [Nostoc sp. C052]|nr:hypothetical protein FD723_05185 [Nostoc sp. C052]